MKRKSIEGLQYNHWTIIMDLGGIPSGGQKKHYVKVKCKCGYEANRELNDIKSGKSRMCHSCATTKKNLKHGLSKTPEYTAWKDMIRRCTNKKHKNYKDYGGRGITVCDRWLESFENFYADIGKRPEGKSLERQNNDKGYSKENCIWASRLEQNKNRRKPARV